MRAAGVHTLFDIDRTGAVGLIEVLGELSHFYTIYKTLEAEIKSGKYAGMILVDYPTLNLRLARLGKKYGCPVFFFVSPQVWAWRKGRIKVIRENIDKLYVVFPFEKDMYAEAGMDVEFMGHPFVEVVKPSMDKADAIRELGLQPGRRVIGLLPGSRKKEIQFLLNVMLEAAQKIKDELGDCQFILPIADTIDPEFIREALKDNPLDIKTVTGKNYDVMNCCDFMIVASGSATLEAGIMGCPMVIIYKLNWMTYLLAKLLVKADDVGLINIVAGRRVVPELIQGQASAQNIARESLKILRDPDHYHAMRGHLLKVRAMLGEPGVMPRIAKNISDYLQARARHEKISV